MNSIWFCGDPHGELDYLIRSVLRHKPSAVVILGDLECSVPLLFSLRNIIEYCDVWYIHGNHDSDDQLYWDNLHALKGKSLHANSQLVSGTRIAGLGGVFDAKVWHPKLPSGQSQNREEYLQEINSKKVSLEMKENMKMISQSFIYPDDYFITAMLSAEILVSHEAPSCHRHGFSEIDDLAISLGARKIFHGHHHETYVEGNIVGVGFREIVDHNGIIIKS